MKVKEILDKYGIQYSNYVLHRDGGTKCLVCGSVESEYAPGKPAIAGGRKCIVSLPEGTVKATRATCVKCGSPYYVVFGEGKEEYYLTIRDSFKKESVSEYNW